MCVQVTPNVVRKRKTDRRDVFDARRVSAFLSLLFFIPRRRVATDDAITCRVFDFTYDPIHRNCTLRAWLVIKTNPPFSGRLTTVGERRLWFFYRETPCLVVCGFCLNYRRGFYGNDNNCYHRVSYMFYWFYLCPTRVIKLYCRSRAHTHTHTHIARASRFVRFLSCATDINAGAIFSVMFFELGGWMRGGGGVTRHETITVKHTEPKRACTLNEEGGNNNHCIFLVVIV